MAVAELHKAGLGRHYLKYARQLDILCHDTMAENISQSTTNVSLKFSDHRVEVISGIFLGAYLTEPLEPGLGHFWVPTIRKCGRAQNWVTPLVAMLKNMDKLIEFNYHLEDSFPESIFDCIKDYQPFCRLNILGCQFVALNEYDSRPPIGFEYISYREPIQVSILDSPTLESFTLYYPWKIQGASPQYVHDEYFLTLARVPNLKHLRIWNVSTMEVIAKARPETKQILGHLDRTTSASTLESLVFFGGCYQSCERIILRISRIFDLSRLRSLEIPLTEDMTLLGKVAPILHSIERLSAMRHQDNPEDLHIFRDESRAVEAILSFRPLKDLRIQVIRSFDALYAILLHHGGSLRSLIIEPSGTLYDAQDRADGGYKFPRLDCHGIRELARLCPNIAELHLQITRSTGDTDEYDAYRALGEFAFLHTLFIDLQCDPRQEPLDVDAELPYEQIFMNAATDEVLAIAIWDTIASHKIGKKLTNLRCTSFGQPFYSTTLDYVLSILGKSMLIKRLDSQGPDSLEVTAIGEAQRCRRVMAYLWDIGEYVNSEEGETEDEEKFIPVLDEEIEDALSHIWPGGWRTTWHSFPRVENDHDV